MEAPQPEQQAKGRLELEASKTALTKKISQYTVGVVAAASLIGVSTLLLVYHVVMTFRDDFVPDKGAQSMGFLWAIFGGFIANSATRKKKAAQLELAAIEQQLKAIKN